MADQTSEPSKPGFFKRLISWPFRLSLPARAAWVSFFFLLALVITAWILFFSDAMTLPWRQGMTWGRMALILGLVAVIPLVVYYGLRLWLEGERSQYPEIDFAWEAGLEALANNGISIHSTPIFLVVGSAGEQQERALLSAAGIGMRVEQVPEGPAPLHWYANPDAIFLFLTECSWLSGQVSLKEKYLLEQGGGSFPLVDHSQFQAPSLPPVPAPAPRQQPAPRASSAPSAPQAPLSGGSGGAGGTIVLNDFVSRDDQGGGEAGGPQRGPSGGGAATSRTLASPPPDEPGEGRAASGGAPQSTRTLVLDQPNEPQTYSAAASGGIVQRSPSLAGKVAQVPAQESAERLQQLTYICQLLRRIRQPVCPINGVLALIPFALVQGTPRELEETEKATKSDLLAIQRELQLRCPVVTLITGMEREAGFRELVRRVGREPASTQRFGKGYDLRATATLPEMQSLSAHVCGAFEDWVYTLFRERGALTRPGNTRLYGLLCKVRCTLKTRLGEVLGRGFGFDKQQTPADDPFLFSGCYFAATGETPDRQAFVRGVINKLVDEQEQIEWTQQALENEVHYRRWALAGAVVSGVLLLTLLGAVIYPFTR